MEPIHAAGNSGNRLHVVAIPYPGRGHISPMLNLCRSLTSAGISITFIVTDEWLQILLSASLDLPPNLRLLSIPNVIPSERNRSADMRAFVHAVLNLMAEPVEELLARLKPEFVAIIADAFLPWVVAIGGRLQAAVTMLFTQSATMFLGFHLLGLPAASGFLLGVESEYLNYIPPTSVLCDPSNPSVKTGEAKFIEIVSWFARAQCIVFTSIYELESHAVETLKSKLQMPIYCLGRIIPHMALNDDDGSFLGDTASKWLDEQPRSSVLYVSFGSYLMISSAQMEEISCGLRDSGVRFLWVVRGEQSSLRQIAELSGGLGMVVPWCNQLRVLFHRSVGGFLTHCGWNSILEAMCAGVPMLTFPLFWDQHPNSKLVADVWKVGFRLRAEGKAEMGTLVRKEELSDAVRKLMDLDNDESKEMRRRAAELGERCQKAFVEGGSVSNDFDAFVHQCFAKGED